ncbi:hypothetical protein PS6_011610 [Mucor atramentarius]
MTDDEAVDKFLAGLKDPNARIHVKDVIDINDPILTEAIRAAHTYEGNRTEIDYSGGLFGGSMVNDPMDLSVAERRELYHMMKSSWTASGTNSFRGGYNGSRGGFRGGGSCSGSNSFRGGRRGARGDQQQRDARGGGRAIVQYHNCEEFGHYKSVPLLRTNSSAYLYYVLPTSKSCAEPLLINDSVIRKDMDFVLSAGKIDTKLPVYNNIFEFVNYAQLP